MKKLAFWVCFFILFFLSLLLMHYRELILHPPQWWDLFDDGLFVFWLFGFGGSCWLASILQTPKNSMELLEGNNFGNRKEWVLYLARISLSPGKILRPTVVNCSRSFVIVTRTYLLTFLAQWSISPLGEAVRKNSSYH